MHAFIPPSQINSEDVRALRHLRYLTVVDAELEKAVDRERSPNSDKERNMCRRELISLLKDSPSTERKFLRWKIAQSYQRTDGPGWVYHVVTNKELEVLPETPP